MLGHIGISGKQEKTNLLPKKAATTSEPEPVCGIGISTYKKEPKDREEQAKSYDFGFSHRALLPVD